jgi:hypothetical protein
MAALNRQSQAGTTNHLEKVQGNMVSLKESGSLLA